MSTVMIVITRYSSGAKAMKTPFPAIRTSEPTTKPRRGMRGNSVVSGGGFGSLCVGSSVITARRSVPRHLSRREDEVMAERGRPFPT